MVEQTASEKQKKEIREQIHALELLSDRLPESKDEVIARLAELQKKIRVMPEKRDKPAAEDDTYVGS